MLLLQRRLPAFVHDSEKLLCVFGTRPGCTGERWGLELQGGILSPVIPVLPKSTLASKLIRLPFLPSVHASTRNHWPYRISRTRSCISRTRRYRVLLSTSRSGRAVGGGAPGRQGAERLRGLRSNVRSRRRGVRRQPHPPAPSRGQAPLIPPRSLRPRSVLCAAVAGRPRPIRPEHLQRDLLLPSQP